MEPEEYEIMYRVEDHHWWYQGMAAITRAVLDRWYKGRRDLQILDAGCGTGAAMTSYLADYGCVTGVDVSRIGLGFCRQRHAERLICGSGTMLPLVSEAFDLVSSFDVLYERAIEDDSQAMREAWRVLRPGGRMIIRLPAYEWIRSSHDEAVHTARRYRKRKVRALLEGCGFAVEQLSYANTFLFAPAVLYRMAKRLASPAGARSDLEDEPGIWNRPLMATLAAEAPFVRRNWLPFGLSVVAVGRKWSC